MSANSATSAWLNPAIAGRELYRATLQVLVHLEQIGLVIQAGAQGLAQGRLRIAGNDHDRAMHFGDDAYRRLAVVISGGRFGHDRSIRSNFRYSPGRKP